MLFLPLPAEEGTILSSEKVLTDTCKTCTPAKGQTLHCQTYTRPGQNSKGHGTSARKLCCAKISAATTVAQEKGAFVRLPEVGQEEQEMLAIWVEVF